MLTATQLGLQLQVGQDVSAVKDDVSAVKDNFDLYQASLTILRKVDSRYTRRWLPNRSCFLLRADTTEGELHKANAHSWRPTACSKYRPALNVWSAPDRILSPR